MNISVIIPAFNSAKFILDAISSVLSQTYHPLEIIVVDDCSTDGTDLILKPYLDRIIYYKTDKNYGPSAARNIGISISNGEWIAFLDADDIWINFKLQKQVDYALNYNFEFVISDMYQGYSPDVPEVSVFNNFVDIKEGFIFERLLKSSYIYTPTVLIKKTLLLDYGCFNEAMNMMEDLDLFLKIARHHKIGVLNEILVFRRWHENNISKSFLSFDRRAYFWKNLLITYQDLNKKQIQFIQRQYCLSLFNSGYDLFDRLCLKECRVRFFLCLTNKYEIFNSVKYILFSYMPKKLICKLRKFKNIYL